MMCHFISAAGYIVIARRSTHCSLADSVDTMLAAPSSKDLLDCTVTLHTPFYIYIFIRINLQPQKQEMKKTKEKERPVKRILTMQSGSSR